MARFIVRSLRLSILIQQGSATCLYPATIPLPAQLTASHGCIPRPSRITFVHDFRLSNSVFRIITTQIDDQLLHALYHGIYSRTIHSFIRRPCSCRSNPERLLPVLRQSDQGRNVQQILHTYLETRPPINSDRVFVGERGPLTARGVRNICNKYSAFCGFKIHPHLLRHTMAHQFLADNNNDLVSLAQIVGHENLNTTSCYTLRTDKQLDEASDNLSY